MRHTQQNTISRRGMS